jgi:hypothetical protein
LRREQGRGIANVRPTVWMVRGIGASLCSDRLRWVFLGWWRRRHFERVSASSPLGHGPAHVPNRLDSGMIFPLDVSGAELARVDHKR